MSATVAMPSTVEFGTRRVLIVLGVMLASILGRIDGTIVNVALPTIQGNISASFDEATWIIIGYLMANVVIIPLTPWLAARFGRRRLFIVATAGFTLLSLLCATSADVQELIIFRVLQGLSPVESTQRRTRSLLRHFRRRKSASHKVSTPYLPRALRRSACYWAAF